MMRALVSEHRRHRELMSQADLGSRSVVGRSDFDCARSEFGIHVFVGNDDHCTLEERMRQRLPDQIGGR